MCVNFNDKTLYSDNINEDEIYKLITGFTKKGYFEFVEQEEKKWKTNSKNNSQKISPVEH